MDGNYVITDMDIEAFTIIKSYIEGYFHKRYYEGYDELSHNQFMNNMNTVVEAVYGKEIISDKNKTGFPDKFVILWINDIGIHVDNLDDIDVVISELSYNESNRSLNLQLKVIVNSYYEVTCNLSSDEFDEFLGGNE